MDTLTLSAKILAVVVAILAQVQTLDVRVTALEHNAVTSGSQLFGSVTNGDIFTPDGCTSVNGSRICYNRVSIRQATSSLCSIKSPTATSTFADFPQASFSGNAYANSFEWGWAIVPGATTTSLAKLDNVSKTAPDIVATTSQVAAIAGGVDGVIPPNTWINFRLGTSSLSTTAINIALIGTCNVDFKVI